jgi:hypothetical protein
LGSGNQISHLGPRNGAMSVLMWTLPRGAATSSVAFLSHLWCGVASLVRSSVA